MFYSPSDIVRVTVIIQEGYDKEEVMNQVSEVMKNKNFEFHNKKLYDQGFAANIQYSLIDTLKEIEGIESVELSKKVELTTNDEQVEIQVESPKIENDTPLYVGGGIILVVLLAFLLKKLKK